MHKSPRSAVNQAHFFYETYPPQLPERGDELFEPFRIFLGNNYVNVLMFELKVRSNTNCNDPPDNTDVYFCKTWLNAK